MKYTTAILVLLLTLGMTLDSGAQSSARRPALPTPPANSTIWFYIAFDEYLPGSVERDMPNSNDKVYISQAVNVSDDDIVSTRVVTDANGQPSVEIAFTESSQEHLKSVAKNNIGRRLVVFVDGELIYAPVIREPFSDKVVVTGRFSSDEALRLAQIISPPSFRAQLLCIKYDWSTVGGVQEIEAELRAALKDSSIPKALLDNLPGSAPEILFPPKIISCYTPEHYIELLAWLKEKKLLISSVTFPPSTFVPIDQARSAGSIYSIYQDFADAGYPIQATSLVRTADFLGDGFQLLGQPETTEPFITRRPALIWHVAESYRSSGRRLFFARRAYSELNKRGQTAQASLELDNFRFDGLVPKNHVTIMNAFPNDAETAYRDAARQLGFIPLIVSIPLSNEESPATDKGKVRPPDVVETMKTVYTDHRMKGGDELAAHNKAVSSDNGQATDKPSEARSVEVFALKFVDAASIVPTLEQLLRDDIRVVVKPETNKLIFSGTIAALDEFRKLVVLLDVNPEEQKDEAKVPRTKNATSPAEIDQARRAYESSERIAFQIASEIRRLKETPPTQEPSPFNIAAMQDNLRLQVSRSFRSRQTLQEAELAVIEAQLHEARESIAMRNRIEDQIIERRVADLLNPNLKWDTPLTADRARPESKSIPKTIGSLAE